MKHPAEVIQQVASVSGKLAKRQILRDNEFNEPLKKLLRLTYNGGINYYTTVIPKGDFPVSGVQTLDFALDVMVNDLATRRVSGNAAKDVVKTLFMTLGEDDRQCLTWLIKGDVKAGISAKSILEIWPDLFPYHPYMRCSSKGDIGEGISELKGDGIFSRWVNTKCDNPDIQHHWCNVKGMTRSGSPLINLNPMFLLEWTTMPEGVYEGEMLIEEDGKILPRQIGNGIINAVFIAGKKDYNKEIAEKGRKVIVKLWDIITLDEYQARLSTTRREERLANLENALEQRDNKHHLQVMEYEFVKDHAQAVDHYRRMRLRGEEGTVWKHKDAPWKDGTSKYQIKMKVEEAVEGRCIGFRPAAEGSKNEDTFGSILYESECGKVQWAATGLSDSLRKEIWESRDYYLGKIGTSKSNGLTPPSKSNKLWSLFLPNHVEWRDKEKTSANTLEEMQEVFKVV
ncbi:hypothetical protein N9937_01005 [bacterium]|nr:hypothetical protein [bacterium]